MRSLKLAAALGVLAASFACGDDGGNDNVDAGPDVDAGPMIDAAPTSGACGIVLGETFAPYAPPAANGNPVVVLEGHSVVFSNPDGTVLGTATTDVKGAASFATCGRDTQITIAMLIEGFAAGLEVVDRPANLYTFAGVQPGDTVYLGSDFGEPGVKPSPLYANSNISMNQDLSAFSSIDGWEISIGCDGTGNEGDPPAVATIWNIEPYCLGTDNTIDYLARLYDNGEVVGYASSKGVPVVTGSPGLPGDTAVTLPAWTPGDLTYGFVAHDFPPFMGYGEMFMFQEVDGMGFAGDGTGFGNDLSHSLVINGVPEDFGDVFVTSVTAFFGGFSVYSLPDSSFSQIIDLLGDFPRNHFVHFTNEGLPRVVSVVPTTGPNGRMAVSWLADGSLSGASVASASVYISHNAPIPGSTWTIISPNAGAGTVEVPELPEAIADLAPDDTDSVYAQFGAFADLGVFTYEALITSVGFDPNGLAYPEMPNLPLEEIPAGLTARLRRSVWGFFGEP